MVGQAVVIDEDNLNTHTKTMTGSCRTAYTDGVKCGRRILREEPCFRGFRFADGGDRENARVCVNCQNNALKDIVRFHMLNRREGMDMNTDTEMKT